MIISPCATFFRHCLHPEIENVMQVEIGQDRRNHRPLRSPFLGLDPPSFFHHARLHPFLNQTDDPFVAYPVLDELDPAMSCSTLSKNDRMSRSSTQFTFLRDPDVQRVQCIVLAAPRPESIRKTQKVLFPDLVENCPPPRSWTTLSSSAAMPNGRCLPSGFGIQTLRDGLRLICPAMDSPVQVAQSLLQAVSIFFPRHAVHSRRCLLFQAVVTIPEQFDIHVVQQSGELELPCSLLLPVAHGPARLARFPGFVSGTG